MRGIRELPKQTCQLLPCPCRGVCSQSAFPMGVEHGRSAWVHERVSADTEAGVLQRGGDPIDKAGRLTRRRSAKGGPREVRQLADALDDPKTPPEGLSLHIAAMEHA